MAALLKQLGQHIEEDTIRQIADQAGASAEDIHRAVEVALPLLVGALVHETEANAEGLHETLERHHDGYVLERLDEVLRRSAQGGSLTDTGTTAESDLDLDRRTVDGAGILDHLFGERRAPVEAGLSRAVDLSAERVRELLPVVAIIVMNALGRVQREMELDVQGLKTLLHTEQNEIQQALPEEQGSRLGHYLHEEAEGDIMASVEAIGRKLHGTGLLDRLFRTPTV